MPEAIAGEQLESLAASLVRARGEDFFPALVQHLVRVLDAREALIGEVAYGRRTRTLAAWRDGSPVANHEYALEGTPCAEVYAGKTLLIENPRDPAVSSAPRGAYFGM